MQVMTVTGLIDAAQLGVTDAHDHLYLSSRLMAGDEIEDPDLVVAEVRDGAASGLQAIVELTPIGLGRRPDLLREAAQASGVHVIGATGYHHDGHYPPEHWAMTDDEGKLLERMLADIRDGMHPTDWADPAQQPDSARAGVIKAGASLDEISTAERRRLAACAEAARQTGLALVVHTEAGTCAEQIADLLAGAGLGAGRIILAHMDRTPEPPRHLALLERGIWLVYDTIGRIKYRPDSARLDLIETVCAAGHGDQLLLGLDLGRRPSFFTAGGYGLRYLMNDFVPRLRERVGDPLTRRMLVDNPARAFALAGTAAA
jgi:phosphotriesterase-related protein